MASFGLSVDGNPGEGFAFPSFRSGGLSVLFENVPEVLKISRTVDIAQISSLVRRFPLLTYGGPTVTMIDLHLFFERRGNYPAASSPVTRSKDSLLKISRNLMGYTAPHVVLISGGRRVRSIPPAILTWGSRTFKGCVSSVSTQERLFNAQGAPTILDVDISFVIVGGFPRFYTEIAGNTKGASENAKRGNQQGQVNAPS